MRALTTGFGRFDSLLFSRGDPNVWGVGGLVLLAYGPPQERETCSGDEEHDGKPKPRVRWCSDSFIKCFEKV
jgi:hypothetical protein